MTEQLESQCAASEAAASARDALAAEKERLVRSLEEAKWQGRQLERKLQDALANKDEGAEVGGGFGWGGRSGREAVDADF